MFYVYQLRIEDQDKPFYVGKGQGQRAYYHLKADCINNDSNRHKVHTILKAHRDGKEVLVEILQRNMTEQEALNKEIELIALYGRRDTKTGCLTNLTDGGDGVSGMVHTEESRKLASQRVREYILKNPEKRKTQCRKGGINGCNTMWVENRDKHIERVTEQATESYYNGGNREALLKGVRDFYDNPEVVAARNNNIAVAMQSEKNRKLVGERTKQLYNDPEYRKAVFPPFYRSPRYLKPNAPDLEVRKMICACLGKLYDFWVENGERGFSFYINENSVGFNYDNKLLDQPIKQFHQKGYRPWECEEYIEWVKTQPVEEYWKKLGIFNNRVLIGKTNGRRKQTAV